MGRAPCCDKANVKKGPWSPEEDAKLKGYIEKYGTGGNWIALPQKAGLKRCGKSCRLRWLNYLRPNIKHGDFSDEEDRIICSLFANIGSRWSIIAAQLPGRTDNDIKNYWNTKLKKKIMTTASPSQRHNPLFPPPPPLTSHALSSLFKDLEGSCPKSVLGIDPISQVSSSLFGTGYCSAANNSSMIYQQQESLYGKDNHVFVFGSEASCSSNSDGSCNQISYGRDFKQQEVQLHGYIPTAFYGGSNPYNGQLVDKTNCSSFGETLMDFHVQDFRQLINNSSGGHYNNFMEGNKMQEKSICYDFSFREFDQKGYWMRN